MPELAQNIFAYERHSYEEKLKQRRAAENLTKVGSFQTQGTHPILEGAESEPKESRVPWRYVLQPFGAGGGPVLEVTPTIISQIYERVQLLAPSHKLGNLLLPEAPGLVIKKLGDSVLTPKNAFETLVSARTHLAEIPVDQLRTVIEEEEEIFVHPSRSFSTDPIPPVQRSIQLSQEIRLAIPPDDMPRRFSVRVDEEIE